MFYYNTLDVKGRQGEDQCVLCHSNRYVNVFSCSRVHVGADFGNALVFMFRCDYSVCVVCLAPTHPLMIDTTLQIVSVEFQIGRTDRTKNKPSGKSKNKYIIITLHCLQCIRSSLTMQAEPVREHVTSVDILITVGGYVTDCQW